ncbi:hypothetical protein IAT40_006803 [Kwoniella sp. CBS 6097]
MSLQSFSDLSPPTVSMSIPALFPSTILIPLGLFISFNALYGILSPHFKREKQRAYILSTISSGCMTLLSLPYLYTYTTMGFGQAFERCQEGWMGSLGRIGVLTFGTYLFSDVSLTNLMSCTQMLLLPDLPSRLDSGDLSAPSWVHGRVDLFVGYLKYPSQVGLLTGWIHHTVYIGLMIHLLNTRLSPVFLIGCIMELPTFDLAISNLFPCCRNDLRFLSSFFTFRIAFHAILLVDSLRPSSRAVMDGSLVPGVSLGLAMILHVLWFKGGFVGYLKRRSRSSPRVQFAHAQPAGRKDQAAHVTSSQQYSAEDSRTEDEALVDEPMIDQLAEIDPTILDTLSSTTPEPSSPQTNLVTPETTPLMTPRTPSQTPFTFPALPHLPTVSIPSLSLPLSISSLSLPTALNSENLRKGSEGFKDAVKSRWEGQRGRFLINRRTSRMVVGVGQESDLDHMMIDEFDSDGDGDSADVGSKEGAVFVREVEVD